jgi:tRNA (adenine22-N1)-methyltransferase
MVSNGLCDTALACDVAPMPLESAKAHIHSQGLDSKITPILSNGLKNVPHEGVTDVVIAGMGGELISSILADCQWIKNGVNLVLQPMTKWDILRKWLYLNGFTVTKELPCKEGKFVYSVMQVKFTSAPPSYPCNLRYLYCGLVTPDTPDGRSYLLRQATRLKTAGKGMSSSPDKSEISAEMLTLAKQIKSQLADKTE